MLDKLKQWLGLSPKVDVKALMAEGAVVVDVRTPAEYRQGHVPGSINVPLHSLPEGLKKIKRNEVVITCCASGMRSASAASLLRKQGFQKVYNGGSWRKLL